MPVRVESATGAACDDWVSIARAENFAYFSSHCLVADMHRCGDLDDPTTFTPRAALRSAIMSAPSETVSLLVPRTVLLVRGLGNDPTAHVATRHGGSIPPRSLRAGLLALDFSLA